MNQIDKIQLQAIDVTPAEAKVVDDIRAVKFGRVVIFIQNGKPYRKEITEQQRVDPTEGGSAGEAPKKQGAVEI
jgi:hypothetical protein